MLKETVDSVLPKRTRFLMVSLLLVLTSAWVGYLAIGLKRTLAFDDAYMFYRYALQMKHGYGFSWNPGGSHTYGPTSLTWTFFVWLMSHLPLGPAAVLSASSWLASCSAVVAMAWATTQFARSAYFMSTWITALVIGVLLFGAPSFRYHSLSGMETMLSMAMNALACGFVFRWLKSPSRRNAVVCALIGVASVLTRPDNALPLLFLYALADQLLLAEDERGKTIGWLLLTFGAGIGAELLLCKLYFHTAVPLSFYLKVHRGYSGYTASFFPVVMAAGFIANYLVFELLIVFLAGGRQLSRLCLCFVTPGVAMAAYYTLFVLQVMGTFYRYYLPILPFVLIPALLVTDNALVSTESRFSRHWFLRIAAVATLLLLIQNDHYVENVFERHFGLKFAYSEPVRAIEATAPLPQTEWFTSQVTLTDTVIRRLPKGAIVAASELGYLSASSPDVNVVDISGLNDIEIALNGFNAKRLLDKKPDLIWFPPQEYTEMYGRLYTEPELLREYSVIDGAFNYGLAIRKNGPYEKEIQTALTSIWPKIYPGYRLADYIVHSVTWNDRTHRVYWDGEKYIPAAQ